MKEETEYELERQKIIAENQALLTSLGLEADGEAKLNLPAKSVAPKPKKAAASRKRKAEPVEHAPARRSGRIAGLEADGQEIAKRNEAEEVAREVARVANRKERQQIMPIVDMVEETPESLIPELAVYLPSVAASETARTFPSTSATAKEAYADKSATSAEVERLKSAFSNMTLRANSKVTTERVFSMVVHPEPTKTLVLVGDKYGQLGIWDALGPGPAVSDDESEDDGTGRIWRVQAHARNSITAMKVDPVNGSSLYTSSYDCTLRKLDFATLTSTELFAFDDEDMLITHFDLTPSGQEAWMSDKNGGISHCDFREGGERRRWVVQDEGRAAKLGGISVNPLMPHLICTAGNDQHVRVWDVRHFSKLNPLAAEKLSPPAPPEGEDVKPRIDTYPTSSIENERVQKYLQTPKGKGLQRAAYQHGKSCSAAYWDPWGRRIVTTSYDDKLRVWELNPQSFVIDQPLAGPFKPSTIIKHDCQTGRWLTILRAQWSLNTEYMPHFTVGNMKRTLDVFTATGERIAALWTDGVTAVPAVTASHPSRVDHVVGGNTSGRIQLWTSGAE
ncbi:DNA damage-binding protein CMR1 [Vanrija pseudolonga]|uniref:DNA damage-binding protein CMR1 n=1 Tax=Vanrija pseudolonga TaxID=143232 RepID=A0AAF0Y962_9TREE|nr:DNA damage-binding protein CMR1 [Vanrija pseudolonga]